MLTACRLRQVLQQQQQQQQSESGDEFAGAFRTCSGSLVTALDGDGDAELVGVGGVGGYVADYIFGASEMNFKESGVGRVHFSGGAATVGGNDGDGVSLYGTPKEEAGPGPGPANMGGEPKPSFIRNQLQALFQPTDNKLAMKLFGSKKALMKERIRQKAAGHWIIHPCSNFR